MKLPVLALDQACLKITDGTHRSPPILPSGIPYVTAKHVKPEGLKFFEDPWFISEEDHRAIYSRCDPKKGDVLYIKDGATTGIAALNNYDFPFSMLSSVALLRPKPELCDSRFLCLWLNSPLSKERFIAQMGGAAIKRLTLAKIKQFEIPLPPLKEQRRIAEVLDQSEALRAKRRASLAQLDSVIQSLFFELFGDPTSNEKGFPTKPLASLVRDDDTINYGVVQPGDDLDEGIPLIRVSDLIEGKVRRSNLKRIAPTIEAAYKRSRLRGDEILVSCVGSIGIVALADESVRGFNIARAVARIPLAESTSRVFVATYLGTAFVQRYFTSELRTVSQPTLNIKQISETTVVLPPIELQQEFARRITAVEKLKAAQRASLAELDALFDTLQHCAFGGERHDLP